MIADIGDADHITRYCSPRKLEEDGTPAPGAFRLRDRDDCCLSVNWLGCFGGQSADVNIQHVRKELRKHYKTKKSGKLVVLNVGVAKRATRITNNVDISVRRGPQDGYISHTCLGGYSTNNSEVATTLSEMVGEVDMYRAV